MPKIGKDEGDLPATVTSVIFWKTKH